MKMKSRAIVMIVLSCILLLSACNSGNNAEPSQTSNGQSSTGSTQDKSTEGKKVKLRVITITTDENRNNIMEQYIKPRIAEALPNIEVEFEPGGGGEDMANKLKTLNASGDVPDVFWSDAGYFTPLKGTGSIMDLTPYITNDGF